MKKVSFGLKTVFSRILFFNTLLILLATIIPQTVFYSYFTQTYDGEVKKNSSQNVKKLKYSVDEIILERVSKIPIIYFSNTAGNTKLTYPLESDISRQPMRVYDVIDTLADVYDKIPFIDSVEVYYKNGNVYFYGNSMIFLNHDTGEKAYGESRLNALLEAGNQNDWIGRKVKEIDRETNFISYIVNIPQTSSESNRQAVVAVNINEDALFQLIGSEQPNEAEKLFIVDPEGNVVTHSDRTLINTNIKHLGYIHEILRQDKDGSLEMNVDGKASVIYFSKSAYNGWRYISVASAANLLDKSRQLKYYLITISVVLLLINLGMAFFFTARAHKPLKSILNALINTAESTHADQKGSENEYRLLDKVVNNVAVQMDELNRQLEVNGSMIRHNVITHLLHGNVDESIETAARNMDIMGEGFQKKNITCFIVKIYGTSGISYESEMKIKYSLIEVLERKEALYGLHAILDERNLIVGILNYDDDMAAVTAHLQKKVESMISTSFTICMGKTYPCSLEKISSSYAEAIESLRYTYIMAEKRVLNYESLNMDNLKGQGSSPKVLNKMVAALRNLDEEGFKSTIDSIIEGLMVGGYRIEYCLNTLSDLVSLARTTMNDMGIELDSITGYDVREYYKSIDTIEDFRVWILGIAGRVFGAANEKKEEPGDILEEKIRKYINENLFNDISLTAVSEGLYMNPSYLSRKFKSITGQNFTEYVTGIKLEYAIKLLRESNHTVKDIATILGYTSPNHFIRIFKEKYACTPKEYQKNLISRD